jgi:hypothetical protein
MEGTTANIAPTTVSRLPSAALRGEGDYPTLEQSVSCSSIAIAHLVPVQADNSAWYISQLMVFGIF